MSSPAKLTDTQRAILFEVSKRKDRCLIAPKTLKAAATQKVAAKLLKAGLVSEIKARSGMEIWRRDEETGQAYSLKLTVGGLKAIPADERGSQSIPSTAVSPNTNDDSPKAKTAAIWRRPGANGRTNSDGAREGTKIARVIELLQRDQGARLEELIAATGWLPHTARAALTGLRHRGYDVRLERGEPAAPQSTAPSLLSRPARDPNATEPEELDAAADQFGRRAAWTDRRRQPRPERLVATDVSWTKA